MAGNQNAAHGYREAFVCARHKALMETGAPWDMEGRNVLMGQDLAPILEKLSVRACVGSAGCTLTLEFAGQIKPVEVFLMPSEARTLSTYIGAANGGFGCT
jgi:hypothetical protein